MLRGLFGSKRMSTEVREAVIDYLKKETGLNALQDDEAGRYNATLTAHGAGLASGSDAARAVAAAASRMAETNRALVNQHSALGPIPDEAGACYVGWHLTYLALAEWAEAAAAAYQSLADGGTPFTGRVQQLLQEEEQKRQRAMKAEAALCKRIKLTAEELRQVIGAGGAGHP